MPVTTDLNTNTRAMLGIPGPALAKALVAAQKAAQAVEKASVNSFHKYRYASAEAVIGEARAALSAAGIAVYSCRTEVTRGRIHVRYCVCHESGEFMLVHRSTPVIPEKGRPLDKAEATALTYDLGYFLRGLLLLPRVEPGTNADARDDRSYVPAAKRAGGNGKALDTLASRLERRQAPRKVAAHA